MSNHAIITNRNKPGNDVSIDWFDREETRSMFIHTVCESIAKGYLPQKGFHPEQQRAAFDHDDDKELTA